MSIIIIIIIVVIYQTTHRLQYSSEAPANKCMYVLTGKLIDPWNAAGCKGGTPAVPFMSFLTVLSGQT